ncbi:hypothetical protein GCM10007973_02560 [Polymorphobacter multimanifer]|uniref:TniQ domain-containing protein n=1 Tax=Polymorphobacter multimanifer TaxID=1070431 RepID=A0A841L6P4_9SPHN|nr:TniQ family protein [Polymorphobacter multimanifer]MBB6228639.1 hypothetical protein [Polymorphobacter multimanifer]GGI68966.1 hypothetical protein GCM10007973_02560 [Polymorphobacter multimanifer]
MLSTARRVGRLPVVPRPEVDELLSSWLRRTAAFYGAKPNALLAQLETSTTDTLAFDWAASPDDVAKVALALGTTRSDVIKRSFIGIPTSALMFIETGTVGRTCPPCFAEFTKRGMQGVVLLHWKLAVASRCGRCGNSLRGDRTMARHRLTGWQPSAEMNERRDDVINIVRINMYDPVTMAVVERLFQAVATPIRWPVSSHRDARCRSIGNGPALMWRHPAVQAVVSRRATPLCRRQANFASWPEAEQIIAAACVHQLATAPAQLWVELKRLGLIKSGDTTLARHLFRP